MRISPRPLCAGPGEERVREHRGAAARDRGAAGAASGPLHPRLGAGALRRSRRRHRHAGGAWKPRCGRRLLEPGADGPPLLATMEDSFSHQVQITEPKACLAENAAAGMEQLMQLYVEPRRLRGRQALSGRAALARSMRTHFEHARVWDLMQRRIAASAYTQPGDSLKIDCGYRPNGVIRMFHAVSLARRRGAGQGAGLQRTGAAQRRGPPGKRRTGTDGDRRAAAQQPGRSRRSAKTRSSSTASAWQRWRRSRSASSPSTIWSGSQRPRGGNCGCSMDRRRQPLAIRQHCPS